VRPLDEREIVRLNRKKKQGEQLGGVGVGVEEGIRNGVADEEGGLIINA
jgi:hypothetical protein